MFAEAHIETVLHFAGVAYVAESVNQPLLYYHNITSNMINMLRLMEASNINKLIFSSTCATYGNVTKLPITEHTQQHPVNPYGSAKLEAEKYARLFQAEKGSIRSVAVLRYFNVYGNDHRGRIGEAPDSSLVAKYGRISNACFDVALGKRMYLEVFGVSHNTQDGTAIRDYIHVTDLVRAHVSGIRISFLNLRNNFCYVVIAKHLL